MVSVSFDNLRKKDCSSIQLFRLSIKQTRRPISQLIRMKDKKRLQRKHIGNQYFLPETQNHLKTTDNFPVRRSLIPSEARAGDRISFSIKLAAMQKAYEGSEECGETKACFACFY